MKKKAGYIIGLFVISLSSLICFNTPVLAENLSDIMFNDGRVISYDDLNEYAKNIPSETFPEPGLGYSNFSRSDNISPYTIIGEDERQIVPNVLEEPFRSVVRIHVTFPDGFTGQGSGAFISADTLLTAGHNLYRPNNGGWATQVRVLVLGTPGYQSAQYFMVPRGEYERVGGYDIGAVKLSEPYGNTNGWFGMSQNVTNPATLTAFHGDDYSYMKTQTNSSAKISHTYQVSYTLDAIAGSSGGPVYNNRKQIMAVNVSGGIESNYGIMTYGNHYKFAHYSAFFTPIEISELKISNPISEIEVGEEYQFLYGISPQNATSKEVIWESSDSEVATIDNGGRLVALSKGTVSIKIRAVGSSIETQFVLNVIPKKITGMYGTVPWVWDDNTQTITFGAGEFPETSTYTNILNYIQHNPLLNGRPIKHIVFSEPVMANSNSSYLFSSLTELETIDNLDKLNTSNVTSMHSMFYSANSLTSLDLSNWDTSNVTAMNYMFYSANSLTSLDLSNWSTSSVVSMAQMFKRASSLTSLDLSNWDTSNVRNMSEIFSATDSLTSLKLGEKTRLNSSVGISEKTDSPYSGRWINEAGTQAFASAKDLAINYDGSSPGLYLREVLSVK